MLAIFGMLAFAQESEIESTVKTAVTTPFTTTTTTTTIVYQPPEITDLWIGPIDITALFHGFSTCTQTCFEDIPNFVEPTTE
ncbi:hypothetical protein HK100_001767, partial [Physocladia obscura]